MKYFFVLLFFFAIKIQDGLTQENSIPNVLASVREYPSFLHKCTATFITTKHLLTTAACVFCVNSCRQQVQVLSSYNTPDSSVRTFDVVRTAYYPPYLNSKLDNNVGVIEIDNSLTDVPFLPVVKDIPEIFALDGSVFGWQFDTFMANYHLHKFDVQTVSNPMCSDVLNRYVSSEYICVLSTSLISRGPFDQGSPLIVNVEGIPQILGIYNQDMIIANSSVIPFHLMPPFYDWIDEQIKK